MQLRDRHQEFVDLGASVATVGMGTKEMAADFRDRYEMPFPLLVDRTKETYRILELKRGNILEIAGPQVWWRGVKGFARGHPSALPKQDPYQMGGAVVVDRGGKLLKIHTSDSSKHNLPVADLLAALP